MTKAQSELLVFLKDVDPVADTALLALKGKMGYGSRLAGLRRFDYYRFGFASGRKESPREALEALERALSADGTFYNRNKHNLLLELRVGGETLESGFSRDALVKRFSGELSEFLTGKEITNFDIQKGAEGVILRKGGLFLGELLVQEKDPHIRESLGRKISRETGRLINFEAAGVLWWLALFADGEGRAREFIGELAVSERRDKGLFLNPHYQEYHIIGVAELVI